MNAPDVAERNVERLLHVAYRPEPIDPAFVLETEEKVLAACRLALAQRERDAKPDTERFLPMRRRLSWAMAAAGVAAAACLIWYASMPRPARHGNEVAVGPERHDFSLRQANYAGLTPKPRPETAKPQALAIGAALETKQGERRRVILADGSILFVNENSALMHTGARQLRLDRGDIYLEVAPKLDDKRFVVQTTQREFTATGTHFHVAASPAGSGVLVTQGKVKVSDVANEVPAGQQVKPADKQATVAPRASAVLDWLKPLVAAADAPLVPDCKHQGGALIAVDPNGQDLQLTMRKYHIDVHIEDGFARTTIDQTYFNNTWSRLEGTFYFPLPPDASLSRLAMYVLDGKECKLMEGGMAERGEAANAYETIRHERRDPALLEWVDGSTFKMRVFPLEAWQEKRIILSYTQRLSSLYGVTKYRFPGGHNMQIVGQWSFTATIQNAKDWDVLTPSHPAMKRETNEAVLGLRTEARLIKPEQDVILELREREAPAGGATFATYLQDGQRYFMARYRPKLDAKPQRERRDWIVLFEASANRDPLSARTQIEVFRNLLKNAEYDDAFTMLTANTRVQAQSAKPQAATPANVAAAVEWLERTHLVGGCDLELALRTALDVAKTAKNPHLVHLGAGVASLGEFKDDVLAKLIPDHVRYIGVGVGKKWNRALMKMAADRTGGYFTQINPDEPVAWRAFDLLATLNTPRLLDVRVVDPDEKVTYLSDAVSVAEGEEICAFTRGPSDKFELPKRVLISGRLDGKPYRQEIEVGKLGNLPGDGGYLPRTWAKLEIDRLMTDGQDKNRAAITELSKAMYVMSPFTSLLVLENDADYQRFKIDRGRKDHWAMYPCPERIPQVYEPDPAYQRWWYGIEQPKDGQKPSPEQVLDTVLMRLPPQTIYANGRQAHLPSAATARQLLMAGYGVQIDDADELSLLGARRLNRLSELDDGLRSRIYSLGRFGTDLGLGVPGMLPPSDRRESQPFLAFLPAQPRLGLERFEEAGRSAGFKGRGLTQLGRVLREQRDSRLLFLGDAELLEVEGLVDERKSRLGSVFNFEPFFRTVVDGEAAEVFGRPGLMATDLAPGASLQGLDRFQRNQRGLFARSRGGRLKGVSPLGNDFAERLFDFDDVMPGENLPWQFAAYNCMTSSLDGLTLPAAWQTALAEAWMRRLTDHLQNNRSASWLLYSRPNYQVDQRLFGDLTMHAPGLGATWADIQNLVALQAKPEAPQPAGTIDEAARKLFAKARQGGWYAVGYPGVGRIPGVTFQANGAGHFTYQRTLPSGLVETVVCDGATLWHLYPEIGVGTRRPFSRFHFGELSALAPWSLPRIEDLATGADVKAIDERTVALVPVQPPGTKDAKKQPTRQVHMIFAADGALAEIRLLKMPEGKTLARQTFDAQGTVRLFDADGKQLAEHKFERQAVTTPPSVQPKLDDLVVLDMPLRTGDHYRRHMNTNGVFAEQDRQQWLGYFAAACAVGDREALAIFGKHFHAKGDRRLGFYTLLSMGDMGFLDQPNNAAQGIATFNPAIEHPQSPLAHYLAHHQKNRRIHYEADAAFLEKLPGSADGFIPRMTAFRNAWNAWRHNFAIGRDPSVHQREKQKLMEFVRVNTSPLVAFLLQSNLQHLNTHDRADVSKLIYESQKDYVDPLGLGYVLGYDAAYHMHYAGRPSERKEAARLFRELYAQSAKEGMLPHIDGVFRAALDGADDGTNFGSFLRGVVIDFLKKDQPHFALLAALQASKIGNQSLGDELFQHIMQKTSKTPPTLLRLAALEYVVHNHLDARLDSLREQLLSDKELAAKPGVWRLGAALSQARSQPGRAVADFEKALDLEYQQLPDVINLEALRREYRDLLGRYLEIAKAARTLESEPPAGLAGRVVRAADRWRALDSDSREACHKAAQILKALGSKDLAWAYLTTPIAQKPNEAAPWTDLAQVLRVDGDLNTADRAYIRAFQCEETNPQILWDRAQNLLQMGRVSDARRLWQQIADGNWQPRFQALVPQARWHLEHN